MGDQPERDPLVILAEKLMSLSECPAGDLVAALLESLARDVPQHYGPEAQAAYRRWLRRRSELIYSKLPYEPAVLTTSWRWD